MSWSKTNFEGVWIYEPKVFKDDRGYFVESFNASQLPDSMKNIVFVQDNEAQSTRGVVRGLHYQLPPFAQSKLVRCVIGEVLDVIVDIRPSSATFGQSLSIVLSGDNKKQFFVPRGFAHGYAVLSPMAIFAYKCDNYYAPHAEGGLRYNDAQLQIDWMLSDDEIVVSAKDSILPALGEHIPFE